MKKVWIGGGVLLATAFLAYPQADDPLDSLRVCKDTQKLVLENAFVRVIEDRIPVGVTEPRHSHRHGVVVYLSDSISEIIDDKNQKTVNQRRASTAGWSEATVHTVKNAGATEFHAMRIELKF